MLGLNLSELHTVGEKGREVDEKGNVLVSHFWYTSRFVNGN